MCDTRAMSSVMTAGVAVLKVCFDPVTVEYLSNLLDMLIALSAKDLQDVSLAANIEVTTLKLCRPRKSMYGQHVRLVSNVLQLLAVITISLFAR